MRQRGFTIIELMIAVTIIGILAAVAMPLYARYATRAKVAEGLSLAHSAKTAIADYYSSNGDFPDSNAQANIDPASSHGGRIVDTVMIQPGGIIVVTFRDPALAGQTLTFTPSQVGSTLAWACTTTLPPSLRPTQECP